VAIVIRKKSEGISSFDTKDKELAIWLLKKGYSLISMHPDEHTRSEIYHFVITSTIEKTAKDFYESAETKLYKSMSDLLKEYEIKAMKERHASRNK
jgi:hypothetical protein